jgi:hypothetical protein
MQPISEQDGTPGLVAFATDEKVLNTYVDYRTYENPS